MEQYIQNIHATLVEEAALLEEMSQLSEEVRTALVNQSPMQLNSLGARQQTLSTRLSIIHAAQDRVARDIRSALGNKAPTGKGGLKALLTHLQATRELKLLDSVRQQLLELSRINAANNTLLTKQSHSLNAYQGLLDLITGAQKTYDRSGNVQTETNGRRISHSG